MSASFQILPSRTLRRLRAALSLIAVVALPVLLPARGMVTGQVLDRISLLNAANNAMTGAAAPVQFSASQYALVRRTWIDGFLERFRADLSRKDVPISTNRGDSGWRTGFNCVAFTDLFLGNAAAEMMVDQFHERVQADRPAIIAIWYTPEKGTVNPRTGQRDAHSIVLILTDQGPVFVDPQRGQIQLTQAELNTVIHRRA